MSKKETHHFKDIQEKGYRLGMTSVKLRLPKMQTLTPDGKTVTFAPEQNHLPYLRRSNEYPMEPILDKQGSIYGTIPFEDGRKILVAGTSSPYVLEGDHMILWALSGDNFRFQPTFNSLSNEQGNKLFSTAADISTIYKEKGYQYFIGINQNDHEYERQSVQSIRDGVHVHCVGLNDEDVKAFEPLENHGEKRILKDPFAILTTRILEKTVLTKLSEVEGADKVVTDVIPYDEYPYEYPAGTSLVLKDDLNTLKNPAFFPFVQKVHQMMEAEYEELRKCFTDDVPDTFRAKVDDDIDTVNFFRRPTPLPVDEIRKRLATYLEKRPELAQDHLAVQALGYVANKIRKASDIIWERKKGTDPNLNIPIVAAKTMNTDIIMDGLSYNLMIFPHPDDGRVLLSFVPRVTTGGSPLDSMGIKKEQYPVNPQEFKEHIKAMDARIDEDVSILLNQDSSIVPGSAFKGIPKEEPEL